MAQTGHRLEVVAGWRTAEEHDFDATRYARRAALALVEPTPSISAPSPSWGDPVTPRIAAPGRGRRTRVPSAFETQATRALMDELGEPTIRTYRGSTLQMWEVDRAGDGIVCARLSSEDLDKGETAMGQVHGLRDLSERLELRVRYIVVELRVSGVPDMDERPDFEFLRDRIERGEINWVGYRHPDRVARHTYPGRQIYLRGRVHHSHSGYSTRRDVPMIAAVGRSQPRRLRGLSLTNF